MHLVLHLGAHGTDEGLIAGWIARNRAEFERQGVLAPPPRLFLRRLSEALDQQRDADPLTREEALLRGLGTSGQRRWLALSAPGLIGAPADVITPEGFYVTDVARRLYGLRSFFPRCRITVLLAVRSASGILPALLPNDPEAAPALLPMLRGETLPWAQLIAAIRRHLPQARVVVWRHEDLPQVWPDILAHLAGPERILPAAGLLDFAALDLSAEARLRLRRYLTQTPPGTAGQLRRTAQVFAERYGTAPLPVPRADLPDWALSAMQRFDRGYATEWADICGTEGVDTLQPQGG
ncbi:hypothetical protein [Pararhodobacter oceanensis]|uniref:hypothetical protein n=1 Tax=Pararhodobacter oceanensis TaxID=2172121 RepID=UPI003A948B00